MYKFFKILLILVFAIIFKSYSQEVFIPKYFTVISKEKGKQMLNQCSRATPRKVKKFFNLTQNEIQKLDTCFLNYFKKEYLEMYAFQYIGLIIKGKKYININAFAIDNDIINNSNNKWKTEPVDVCDGGGAFWGILFNIENCSFSQYGSNGIA
ncbi:MAG: hypothetical protein HXX18_10850 [Bacteroidetes bacterium]|nr:hypothetical protein [Bacteroidota bacterium]